MDFAWDSSELPNGKYYVSALGIRADDSYTTSPTSTTITVQNPVFKLSPASVKAGKNTVLHLQYAPPHEVGLQNAAARQCVGSDPVTVETWSTRCDASTQAAAKPYKGLTVSVTLKTSKIIHDPASGEPVDCSVTYCSAAINTNGLVMSSVVQIKP